jgi:large subunit ribosomal protein L4
MESKVYNSQGKEVGKITLPETIFGVRWNPDLVHQVVEAMRGNARAGTAHTKDRGEVRGGGRKPWKQKGTGRARHGSTRSPIWKGGGVAHGPRKEKNFSRTINQGMRQKALLVTLSRKMHDNEIIFIDSLEMASPKTAEAKKMLAAFSNILPYKKHNAALIALPNAHLPTMKSFRNFGNVSIDEVRNLNPLSVLGSKYLVIANPTAAIEALSKKKAAKVKVEKARAKSGQVK